ncbi:MAG: lysophospholipid acyltransferase family protein [Rhodospirillales bacterium]|nr:lysophospholipid acyltransferase family protein [Rhodospirillales bacterium]
MTDFLKQFRYAGEAFGLAFLFLVFLILPATTASNLGGWLGRNIGPKLAASRKARRNLSRVFPDISEARSDEIITGMWEHLGRVIAEYPHLETLALDHTQIIGQENLQNALNNPNGAIFFGAHLGNWEINGAAVLLQAGQEVALSYRAPNNPWSNKLLMRARTLGGRLPAYSKSRQGGKAMMETVKNGGALGILIDQKYNQGINVPFFGLEAMTNPFFVQLAQKYSCALVPIRNRRLDGANFSLSVYKSLEIFEDDGKPRAIEDVIGDAHALLEEFILETPEQWLWLHRRWKD